MNSSGDKERAVSEAIGWIQRIAVKTLELEMKPTDLDPDLRFAEMEVNRFGYPESLDSIDLVEVVGALEEALDVELLEDEEFRESGLTIRGMASFLVSRLEVKRLQALAVAAE